MKACALLLLCAALAAPQEAPEKPDPRRKARELLDGAAEMMGAAQPQVQAAALLHLAENYHLFDSSRALEYFRQAFTAAQALPPQEGWDQRTQLQSEIVRAVADINLPAAVEMMKLIPAGSGAHGDPRDAALQKLVRLLLQKKDYDGALALIGSAGAEGAYPYTAVGLVVEKLEKDDPRRVTAFGSAMVAFAVRPALEFGRLIAICRDTIPQQMIDSAAGSFVNWVLDRDEKSFQSQSLSTERGSVTFTSRQEAELFDVMHVVRQADPKRAGEILEKYPGLRGALEKFPYGTASMMGKSGSLSSSTNRSGEKISPEVTARQQVNAIAESLATAALAKLSDDPRKAVEMVQTIPVPAKQAETLGAIARAMSGKDPATARQVLNRCVTMLDDLKDQAANRVATWESVAEAAHTVKDDKLAWSALDRGLADAAELYKQDFDAESPNLAMREYWPSTQSYRRIVAVAAKLFAVEAEPLLAGISDPDLALFSRIEMAQVLLGRPRSQGSTSVSRIRK